MRTAGALGIALLAGLEACRPPPPPRPVVAYVAHQPIYASDLKVELDRARADLVPHRDSAEPPVQPGPQDLKVLRRTVLDELIDRRLLLAKAEAAGIRVTDREVDEALAARHGEPPAEAPAPATAMTTVTATTTTAAATATGATTAPVGSSADAGATGSGAVTTPAAPKVAGWERQLTRDELVIDRFLLREVAARVAVTPAEERAFYDAHPEQFSRPEQVRCSQILVPKKETAQALKVKLTRGAEFAKVASEASTSIDRAQGGDLGWFGHGEMPPEVDQTCFGLKKGEVSGVVQSPYGFHLFKLTDRRPARVATFAEVEQAIDVRLTRERVASAEHDYIEKLRRAAGVSVVEAELDRVP